MPCSYHDYVHVLQLSDWCWLVDTPEDVICLICLLLKLSKTYLSMLIEAPSKAVPLVVDCQHVLVASSQLGDLWLEPNGFCSKLQKCWLLYRFSPLCPSECFCHLGWYSLVQLIFLLLL